MINFLRDLLSHAEWANGVYFHAWGKSPVREHEELRRRVDHLVGVQEGFLAVFRGQPPGGPPSGPPASFQELKDRAQSSHGGLRDFAGALDSAALERKVRIPWIPDPPCIITLADAIVQVAMHSQHHRGQLMTRLKDLGGEPRNVDWILWVWKQKPQPRWN